MSTYAVGSVLGDYRALTHLLDRIGFDPLADRLWFAGNLVDGGGESLAVLRLVKSLGKSAVAVLGDRELQLLACAAGVHHGTGNWQAILDASDGAELMKWLRQRSLVHHDSKLGYTLVHAGIPSEWTFSQALTFAYEVESALSGSHFQAFMENRQQDQSRWHAKLRGWKRLNFIANALTAILYCNEQGKLDFTAQGAVSDRSDNLLPWYRLPNRQTANLQIIYADDTGFNDVPYPGILPLTAGKVLSAIKLEPVPEYISVGRGC